MSQPRTTDTVSAGKKPSTRQLSQTPRKLIPPLHDALLKNEQDVHLFEAGVSEPAV
jgi:hypothetical protein